MTGLGFALAGMAQGTGNAILERAKADRELMKERVRNEWANERQDKLMQHQTDERVASQDFQLSKLDLKSNEKLTTIYDDNGREIKAIVNEKTGEVVKTIGGPKAPSGMEFEAGPDGGFRIATGGKTLTTKNKNEVQGKELDVQEQKMRLQGIRDSVKDEYLTVGGKIGHLFNKGRAMVNPDSLSPEDRENYAAYTSWKQKAVHNVNLTIQQITGAAMGVQEAKRIMASVPNIEDDPIAFKAKMDSVMKEIDDALDLYARQQGKTPPSEIDQKGASGSGELPTGVKQKKTLNGRTYIQDENGNWFEE